ncbi:MAG: outer membrane protein/peptidoglycan-associated protein [Fibrobacteres bacterium]|nr:outer membrane protein/peptidoglycan-associated protein [Fibrobacterota bacterium]
MNSSNKYTALFLAMGMMAGCANMNQAGKGGIIGAGAGGVLGGIIGHASGNTAAGAIIGAAVGGTAGAAIGHYMDKQAAELQRDLKNARVERVGEGIKITFDSGILFDVDSDKLRPDATSNLKNLAQVLNKYDDTEIMVQGHTDNSGSKEHNMKLSDKRADSVGDALKADGVKSGRIDETGMGETQPVADNGSASGRQANRRVEVAIWANDKLKRAAADGKIAQAD